MEGIYGYIYIDDIDGNEKDYLDELSPFMIPSQNIFIDRRISSADRRMIYDRLMFDKLMKKLQKGDTLYIRDLDCLGENYEVIIEQWRILTKVKKVKIAVLEMPVLDTRKGSEWVSNLMSDIVTEVLSYVAVNEHTKFRKRQSEGIEAARRRGVHLGRPASDLPSNFQAKCLEWKSGEISCSEAARQCGMPISSFRYRAELYENAGKDSAG